MCTRTVFSRAIRLSVGSSSANSTYARSTTGCADRPGGGGQSGHHLAGHHGPGGVVGRDHRDQAGRFVDEREHLLGGQRALDPAGLAHDRAGQPGPPADHLECRPVHYERPARLGYRGPAEPVDRVVAAVGHDHALGGDAEPLGDLRFEARGVGVPRSRSSSTCASAASVASPCDWPLRWRPAAG